MIKTIQYGSETISYAIEFTNRKSLGISVYPDRSTIVKAPEGSSIDKINKKFERKRRGY